MSGGSTASEEEAGTGGSEKTQSKMIVRERNIASFLNFDIFVFFRPLPKAHLCDQCGYSCRTPQELGKHRENKHGFFSCHMCSYSTNKKVELTRHLRCAHKTICPECELPLSRGETLETHQCPAAMGPAEGRPELLVQLLAGTTKTKANAKINRLAGENGDGFICVECGHSGDQLLMLQRHVNMRHSSFFCNHCDFRTVNHPTLMKVRCLFS